MSQPQNIAQPVPSRTVWLLLLLAVLLVAKLVIAWRLPLFGDEAFYWLAGQFPAWGYSDLPPLTALLTTVGTGVAGDSYLGVRWPFLLIGGLWLPWLIYRAGAQHTGALWLGLAIPLVAAAGVLALPDVLLLAFTLAAIHQLTVALEDDRGRWQPWLLLGVWLALGCLSHYRFFISIAVMVVWVLLDAPLRQRLLMRWRGAVLAALLTLLGLLPTLWFNLQHDLAGVTFQFASRHPWRLQVAGWQWLLGQVIVVTPLLFLGLAATTFRAWRSPWWREPAIRIWAGFAVALWLFYFIAAFFADAERSTLHWPLPAYVAASIVAVRSFRVVTLRPWAVATGLAGGMIALGWLAVVSLPQQGGALLQWTGYPENFRGWPQLAQMVEAERRPGERLLADNFMTAAELAFELQETDITSLPSPRNRKHGRARQFAIWDKTLTAPPDSSFLLAVDLSALKFRQRPVYFASLCRQLGGVRLVRYLELDHGQREFALFRSGRGCDQPPVAYIDEVVLTPAGLRVRGWAFENDAGISRVEVGQGQRLLKSFDHDQVHTGVRREFPDLTDPDAPRLGFDETIDAPVKAEEPVWIELHTVDGNVMRLARRIDRE